MQEMANSIPELGRCPGGENSNPLQHSCSSLWGHKELDTTEHVHTHTHTHTHTHRQVLVTAVMIRKAVKTTLASCRLPTFSEYICSQFFLKSTINLIHK